MTDLSYMSHDMWEAAENQVRDRFRRVFNQTFSSPGVELIYHEGDYADNTIEVDGWLQFSKVERKVADINGVKTEPWWQLSTVEFIPATRYNPPDCDVNDVGEPHRRLDDCIREGVKLYAQQMFDIYMEQLSDEEQARLYEGQAAEPHSWKP